MTFNCNEKYLLEFISGNLEDKNDELIKLINKFGIKLKFKDHNPVYQIIDELNYGNVGCKIK